MGSINMYDRLTLTSIQKSIPTHIRNQLKVALKHHPIKGLGMVAKKSIAKGELVAYYKLEIFYDENHQSTTNFMYAFDVYTKSGVPSRTFIGDISLNTMDPPQWVESLDFYLQGLHLRKMGGWVPYWGLFCNEPSPGQKQNVYIDMNLDENYYSRKRVREGDFITYAVVATQDIEPQQEILWHYGSQYERDYPVADISSS